MRKHSEVLNRLNPNDQHTIFELLCDSPVFWTTLGSHENKSAFRSSCKHARSISDRLIGDLKAKVDGSVELNAELERVLRRWTRLKQLKITFKSNSDASGVLRMLCSGALPSSLTVLTISPCLRQ